MLSPKVVIPECYIDSCLIDVLLEFEKEGSNHAKGNATVLRKMENSFADGVCVGVIDKDKIELQVLRENYKQIEIKGSDSYFYFFAHNRLPHFVIQINPAIESWILRIARELNIDLEQFGLNVFTQKELGKFTKKTTSKSDPIFKKLFKSIVVEADRIRYIPLLKMKAIILMILKKGNDISIKDFEHV